MSTDIKPGDLVVVVRGSPCGHTNNLIGKVFTVLGIHPVGARCTDCGFKILMPCAMYRAGCAVPFAWLKKIPPLADIETVKREEEITV